jgi:hypothetical protein
MRWYCTLLHLIVAVFAAPNAFAQDEAPVQARMLKLDCSYSPATGAQAVATVGDGESRRRPGLVHAVLGKGNRQAANFELEPGNAAECSFPSGHSVRIKVGVGDGRPYGMCGADPDLFLSIWLDERKIESRYSFASHCSEDLTGTHVIQFRFTGAERGWSAQKCETEDGSRKCTGYPALATFQRDPIEYPAPGTQPSKPGTIERLAGTGEICAAVAKALDRDFDTFLWDDDKNADFTYPAWAQSGAPGLPERIQGAEESVFDLNNDGQPDRVLRRRFESTYMDGSILLARLGNSARPALYPALDGSSLLLPCQFESLHLDPHKCPPFAQEADDSGLTLRGMKNEAVRFRGRYTTVTPFFWHGKTWLGLAGPGQPNAVAVLAPTPDGRFPPACLFRRVEENF